MYSEIFSEKGAPNFDIFSSMFFFGGTILEQIEDQKKRPGRIFRDGSLENFR